MPAAAYAFGRVAGLGFTGEVDGSRPRWDVYGGSVDAGVYWVSCACSLTHHWCIEGCDSNSDVHMYTYIQSYFHASQT